MQDEFKMHLQEETTINGKSPEKSTVFIFKIITGKFNIYLYLYHIRIVLIHHCVYLDTVMEFCHIIISKVLLLLFQTLIIKIIIMIVSYLVSYLVIYLFI